MIWPPIALIAGLHAHGGGRVQRHASIDSHRTEACTTIPHHSKAIKKR